MGPRSAVFPVSAFFVFLKKIIIKWRKKFCISEFFAGDFDVPEHQVEKTFTLAGTDLFLPRCYVGDVARGRREIVREFLAVYLA